LDEARETLEKALEIAERTAPGTSLGGRVMRHLAELCVKIGNYRTARRYLSKATVTMETAHDRVEIGALKKVAAIIAEADGRTDEATALFGEALAMLEATGVRAELAEVLIAAGCSEVYPVRRRLTLLFRAEEFFTGMKLMVKRQEVEKLIGAIDYHEGASGHRLSRSDESDVDFPTNCAAIIQFKEQLAAIGRADLTLLLTGETGVGKDHMARYYHHVVRPGTPYVAINCASVPHTLLESELFGYDRGAFTGADNKKPGLFVAANGGVLLLDEIGDMPLQLQTKLLNVIEEKEVTPLGTTEPVRLDIKLVAATNQDLEAMVERGEFRRDLYYRLSGIPFSIPPLRERKEDIPMLLDHFLTQRKLLAEGQKPPMELVRQFVAYDWPGNTRDLFNKVKRLEVMADLVADKDLVELSRTLFTTESASAGSSLFERVEQFERQLIVEALITAGGNKSEAARMLGIHEATVRTKLKRYDIVPQSGQAS
ncbi:MAG: sigma 54-interacting transcriptional regulator, partial [candidate division Zixibacteria bacterium]|nr:sigma 54-interacting transcriptional regulator [candidate division Zixibacteria bacterium]